MRVSFGATSSDGNDCPAQGDWGAWCDCMFGSRKDTTHNFNCKKPLPFAPWTEFGAAVRGIPHVGSKYVPAGLISAALPGVNPSGAHVANDGGGQIDPSGGGILDTPKKIGLVAGGVVILGAAAFFLANRKKKGAT